MSATGNNKVTVVFSGVVTLCPSLPNTPTSGAHVQKGPLYAVMPKTSEQTVSVGDQGETAIMSAHTPVIFTRLAGTGRAPDDTYGTASDTFNIWHLHRERVQFTSDLPGNNQLRYKRAGTSLKIPIDDMAAVPHLREIASTRQVMKKDAIDPASTIVEAQVLIDSGDLQSSSHRPGDAAGIAVAFHDLSANPPATATHLAMPHAQISFDVRSTLTLSSTSLDTQSAGPDLTFNITQDAEIWVANLDDVHGTIDEILGVGSSNPGGACDVDFAFHYDVVDGSGDRPVPCLPGVTLMGGERKCYVAMAEPPA